MVKTFRVLMANQPKLRTGPVVEMLAEESCIEIVGEVAGELEIREFVRKTSPDLLVVTAESPGERPAICDELLREYPALQIIAAAPNDNYAARYWASLEIHAAVIEWSKQGLLNAIKRMARAMNKGGEAV